MTNQILLVIFDTPLSSTGDVVNSFHLRNRLQADIVIDNTAPIIDHGDILNDTDRSSETCLTVDCDNVNNLVSTVTALACNPDELTARASSRKVNGGHCGSPSSSFDNTVRVIGASGGESGLQDQQAGTGNACNHVATASMYCHINNPVYFSW